MEGHEVRANSEMSEVGNVCGCPLVDETVWFNQNKCEEAEALYHKTLAGTNDERNPAKKPFNCPSDDTLHDAEVSQPLLAENVWFKQNDFENAEAKYHGACASVTSSDKSNQVKESKLSAKKTEIVSWAEKLEDKIKSLEDYSHKLEQMYGGLRKAQRTVETLLPQLTSVIHTCLNLLNDEVCESKTHIDAVQAQFALFKSITASIKEKMARKDKVCYKSYEVFCQSMSDRLSHLLMEMTNLCQNSSSLKIVMCEKNLQEILNNAKDINIMGQNLNTLKYAEYKMVSLISALDNIFKKANGTNVAPSRKKDLSEILSSENSVSIESLDDCSSLCGDCSDFNTEDDDLGNKQLDLGKKSFHQTDQNSGPKPSLSSIKKKSRRGKRGGTNSPGKQSNITITTREWENSLRGRKKSSPGNGKVNDSMQKVGQSSQKDKSKSLTLAVQKSSPNAKKSPFVQSKATLPRNLGGSMSTDLSYGKGSNSSFTSTHQFGSPMFSLGFSFDHNQSNVSSCHYPSFNPLKSCFSDLNPVTIEKQLNEIALKIHSQMDLKHSIPQQMLQEIERLRQLAMQRHHQNFMQEDFQRGYQMLMRAFVQHQSLFSQQQQSQHQMHQYAAMKKAPSKAKTLSQPQPLSKKQKQKCQEKARPHDPISPKTKGNPQAGQDQKEACEALGVGSLPGAVKVNYSSKSKKALRKSFPCKSSKVIQVASFNPQVRGDHQKCGVSSIVVLDDLNCLLIVDIINSCLKLYKYSVEDGPQKYSFRLGTTLNLPGPFYMAKIGGNKVVVTRDNNLLTLIQVTNTHLKSVNSLETTLQYYGVTYVSTNMVAAAAYEANRIDLLTMDQLGHFQVKNLIQTNYGPELLSSIPGVNDIAYLEKVPQQCMYLKGFNFEGQHTFSVALGGGPSDVWNLSCINQKILCSNKQENSLQLFSSKGNKRAFLPWPDGTIDQPFAMCFSQYGDLFLANDGLWDFQENHYVTTEINTFSFING